MSRVELAKIRSLTFYKDTYTTARRTSPLPQLVCSGKPCRLYTPDVVRCENVGGEGTDVDWKCEADLPEALRFGRVEVNCEGWSRPGDPYVLKGSCSLEYRLVEVPGVLRHRSDSSSSSWDIGGIIFTIIWVAFLLLIGWSFLQSCLRRSSQRTPSGSSGPRPGGSGGWFPGGHDDDPTGPPPPYSKQPSQSSGSDWGFGWRPGFWTGAALGGLGATLLNNNRRHDNTYREPRYTTWDWERERPFQSAFSSGRHAPSCDDRGEGPSNLGSMRRSTGLGGSNVR